MDGYSAYTKSLYKSIDQINSKRAHSASTLHVRGIKYKFKMVNLGKY